MGSIDMSLVPVDGLRVLSFPRPFSTRRVEMVLPYGRTIAKLLETLGTTHQDQVRVCIGDWVVPRSMWNNVRPKPGQVMTAQVVPAGGDDAGKNILAFVIAIAAVFAAAIVPAWGPIMTVGGKELYIGQMLARTAIMFTAALIATALIPPPSVGASSAIDEPSYTITGIRNTMLQYGPIPKIYGKRRIYPHYGAWPFTEQEGDEQYLRLVFVVGYGPLRLSELKIGETPLEQYQGVEWVINRDYSAPEQETYTALHFDGTTDVTVAHDNSLNISTLYDQSNITIEARFRIDAMGSATHPIINKGTSYQVWVNADRTIEGQVLVTLPSNIKKTIRFKTAALVEENTDHHFAFVKQYYDTNGLAIRVYLNGEEVYTADPESKGNYAIVNNTSDIVIGKSGSDYLLGTLREIRLWSLARTASEIYSYRDEALEGDEDGLLGYWKLDEGTGTTATDSAGDNDGTITNEDWQTTITVTPTLWSMTVLEENPGVVVHKTNGWIYRTTKPKTDEISIDITLPGGLYHSNKYNEDQATDPETVTLEVEYREVGAADWIFVHEWNITDNTRRAIRKSRRWRVPQGQYEVRIQKTTDDLDLNPPDASKTYMDTVYWTAFRSIRHQVPINMDGLCTVSMRIKATEQLNGVVDTFNCIAEAILPVYEDSEWTPQITRNPAWALVDMICGSWTPWALAYSRLDLTTISAWAVACETAGRSLDAVIDYETRVDEVMFNIAASGRASLHLRDGLYSVIRDYERTTPVQHFTPRNSWGFTGHKTFIQIPHALRVMFLNPDLGYQQDERIVYDDGYDESTATIYETLDLTFYCSDAEIAYRDGRYYLKTAHLRPEVYEFQTDVENICCERGDLVLITHDVPLWGLGWGRVKTVTLDDDDATGVTLDETLPMEAGTRYVLRFRLDDGTSLLKEVQVEAGSTNTFTFLEAIAGEDPQPKTGDLCMFGEYGTESTEVLIKSIIPHNDLSATLTVVDHSPALYDDESSPAPAFETNITRPPTFEVAKPEPPLVASVKSDESAIYLAADGSLVTRILVKILAEPNAQVPAEYYQTQFRLSGFDTSWTDVPVTSAKTGQIEITGVIDGLIYDIRIRGISRASVVSHWRYIYNHTVIGKMTPPPNIAAAYWNGSRLSWEVPTQVPIDFAGYRVRSQPGTNAHWGTGIDLHDTILTVPHLDLPNGMIPGTYTLMVCMVDRAGIESTTPATLEVTFEMPENWIDLGKYDIDADDFSAGTLSGGTIDLVNHWIEADTQTTAWGANEKKRAWNSDDSIGAWDDVYEEMIYQDAFYPPAATYTTMTKCFAIPIVEVEGGSWRIEWATNDDYLDDGTVKLHPWIGGRECIMLPSAVEIYFRIIVQGGRTQGVVKNLDIQFYKIATLEMKYETPEAGQPPDGSRTQFDVANPFLESSFELYYNNVKQRPTTDYTVDGTGSLGVAPSVTTTFTPANGSSLYWKYRY